MKLEKVAIKDLVFDPANARKHTIKNLDSIKGSLARFGQQKPIVVGANNVVIAGNGTLEAARDLGWEFLDAVRTELVGPDAIAFALADNRTAELAEWDYSVLGDTLKSLAAVDFDLSTIGFDDADFALFCDDKVDGAADEEWKGMPEFAQDDLTAETRLIVNFKSIEDLESFARLVGQPITNKTRSIWFPMAEIDRYMDKRYTSES